MLRIINGTGKCCPDCGVEVNLIFDDEFDYICPECGQLLYSWECGNTVETTMQDIKDQEALEH